MSSVFRAVFRELFSRAYVPPTPAPIWRNSPPIRIDYSNGSTTPRPRANAISRALSIYIIHNHQQRRCDHQLGLWPLAPNSTSRFDARYNDLAVIRSYRRLFGVILSPLSSLYPRICRIHSASIPRLFGGIPRLFGVIPPPIRWYSSLNWRYSPLHGAMFCAIRAVLYAYFPYIFPSISANHPPLMELTRNSCYFCQVSGNGLDSGVLRSEGCLGTKIATLLAQRARAPLQNAVLGACDPVGNKC